MAKSKYTPTAAKGIIRNGPIPNAGFSGQYIGRRDNPGIMGVFINDAEYGRSANISKATSRPEMVKSAVTQARREGGAKNAIGLAGKARGIYNRWLKEGRRKGMFQGSRWDLPEVGVFYKAAGGKPASKKKKKKSRSAKGRKDIERALKELEDEGMFGTFEVQKKPKKKGRRKNPPKAQEKTMARSPNMTKFTDSPKEMMEAAARLAVSRDKSGVPQFIAGKAVSIYNSWIYTSGGKSGKRKLKKAFEAPKWQFKKSANDKIGKKKQQAAYKAVKAILGSKPAKKKKAAAKKAGTKKTVSTAVKKQTKTAKKKVKKMEKKGAVGTTRKGRLGIPDLKALYLANELTPGLKKACARAFDDLPPEGVSMEEYKRALASQSRKGKKRKKKTGKKNGSTAAETKARLAKKRGWDSAKYQKAKKTIESHIEKGTRSEKQLINDYNNTPTSNQEKRLAYRNVLESYGTKVSSRKSNPGRKRRRRRKRNPAGGLTLTEAINKGNGVEIAKHVGASGLGYASLGLMTFAMEKVGVDAKNPAGLLSRISNFAHKGKDPGNKKARVWASGLSFLALGAFTGGIKYGAGKAKIAFLEKVTGKYTPSFLIGAGVHLVRNIVDVLVEPKQKTIRTVFGLSTMGGYEIWYPEMSGYEVWSPELSGYENWTPELSGYENWTPELSGYENWTPELSGYENWTPELSGWDATGYEAMGELAPIGYEMGAAPIGYEAMSGFDIGYEAGLGDVPTGYQDMSGNPFGEPF